MNLELKKSWLVDPFFVSITEVFYKEVTLNSISHTEKYFLVFKDEEMLSYSSMAKVVDNYEEALTLFEELKKGQINWYKRAIKEYEDSTETQKDKLGIRYKSEIEFYKKTIENYKENLV